MNEFDARFDAINKDELKAFLLNLKKPCYESELLKVAFNDLDITNDTTLRLYQDHFVLFHYLFKLQDEFYGQGKYLHVHFMRTFLLDYPGAGSCRFYDESFGKFCGAHCNDNANYCEFHTQKVGTSSVESISSKYFYLDTSNFYKLNEKTADEFISGAWEIVANYEKYKNSFKILELPESANFDMVKKQYKILAKKYHPDSKSNDDFTENKEFFEINNAYRFLVKILSIKTLKK